MKKACEGCENPTETLYVVKIRHDSDAFYRGELVEVCGICKEVIDEGQLAADAIVEETSFNDF